MQHTSKHRSRILTFLWRISSAFACISLILLTTGVTISYAQSDGQDACSLADAHIDGKVCSTYAESMKWEIATGFYCCEGPGNARHINHRGTTGGDQTDRCTKSGGHADGKTCESYMEKEVFLIAPNYHCCKHKPACGTDADDNRCTAEGGNLESSDCGSYKIFAASAGCFCCKPDPCSEERHPPPIDANKSIDYKFQVPFPGLSETIKVCSADATIVSCSGTTQYIVAWYEFLMKLAIILAVLIITLAGFRWMFARGDTGMIAESKKMISNTIIGLVLALGSYTLLWAINPQLILFGPMELMKIKPQTIDIECTEEIPTMNPNFEEISKTALQDPGTIIARINQLMVLYKKVAQEMNVPWELLAATHYQEAGNNPNKSMLNGFDICNNRDKSRCPYCAAGATQENDFKCAAKLMHEKANMSGFNKHPQYSYRGKFDLDQSSPITADPSSAIANVMFRYNGVCPKVDGRCQDITGSAYIMNMLTPAHENMRFEGRRDSSCKSSEPGCVIKKTWGKRDGALRFIMRLKNTANFDGSGKLIKMD